MKRNTLNLWIDVISFSVMLGLIWTGLLIHYVLPPGTGGRHGQEGLTLWGLGRHDYGDIHFYLAIALIGLMVVHVWLHWSWLCATVNKLLGIKSAGSGRRTAYGVTLLVIITILIFGGLFWARSRVEPAMEGIEQEAIGQQFHSSFNISGQTTLAEAAKMTPMPVEELIFQLKLPADVDIDEQLGRLKRKYGFEIHDVGKILQQNK